jgi:hypothetical protein
MSWPSFYVRQEVGSTDIRKESGLYQQKIDLTSVHEHAALCVLCLSC